MTIKDCRHCGKSFKGKPAGRFCSLLCARHSRVIDPNQKFFSYIDNQDHGCWNWTGHIHHSGYGMYRSEGAHRFSYMLVNGQIPNGLWVLHTCDNRKCVNPAHLFLGTVQDNVDDMIAKGRAKKAKGESVANSRLSTADVIAIREDDRLYAEIAKDYAVAQSTISAIKTRRNWAHVR